MVNNNIFIELVFFNKKKAPELLESERYTNKSDIWAIGIVFY